jgi:hypothetical protein
MSQENRAHLSDLQFEHKLWLNELKFREDEITIFEKQLESLIQRRAKTDSMPMLESFQNKFILQFDVINELKNDVRRHENFLKGIVRAHTTDIADLRTDYQDSLRERMDQFRHIFNHLKKDFFEFILPW